ncbi:centromere-associated protein E-like [Macrosteles quadrilineatus]|uniref:centromere-associated protein E-like n=1 Tax=Macrosteles quadrilineatus TaxID=74068 RepID=UPI0023E2B3C6|nr:centromere-associated protein E-like [Macrosteles quadrilineatus]
MNSKKIIPKTISSCHKHTKSRSGRNNTHSPSIKCHEEVMSRLSSCTNENCDGDLDDCIEQSCIHRKVKYKRDNVRTVPSRSKLTNHHQQSFSAPGSKHSGFGSKDLTPKTVRSKSIPSVQTTNFNDSVDIIPVKLTSTNDRKQRPQKRVRHILESRPGLGVREKSSKPHRPTWDEILRNNLEVVSKGDKSPNKKTLQSNKISNCCHSEHSVGSSVNKTEKHSSKEINNCRQDEIKQNCLSQRASESSKSTDSSQIRKFDIFQQINSDPIKSLDMLIKQLRDGLLKQPQNDCLQNIISDMENAMLKISVDGKTHQNHQFDREINDKAERTTDIQSAATNNTHEKVRNKHVDIVELEQNLEKSCRYLQSLCIKQKENCSNHLREKEQLSLQLAESRRLLAVTKSKEKNYEVTIGELRLKLQEYNTKVDQLKQSLQDVQNKNVTLKEENKAMRSLKDTLKRVGVRLKQLSREKENLQSKLSLKDLEIEKLKVILQIKSGHKVDGQQEKQHDKLLDENIDVKMSEKDMSITLSSVSSWSGRGLICSSQASSSPRHSPSPYNSWQHISSIVQEPSAIAEINRGIAVKVQDINRKYRQMEPLHLDLQNPSSCSSFRTDGEVIYSDGESGSFSS